MSLEHGNNPRGTNLIPLELRQIVSTLQASVARLNDLLDEYEQQPRRDRDGDDEQ